MDLKEKILTRYLEQTSTERLSAKSFASEQASESSAAGHSDKPKERPSDKAPRLEGRRLMENQRAAVAELPARQTATTASAVAALQRPEESPRPLPSENNLRGAEPLSRVSTAGANQRPPDPMSPELLNRIKSRIQSKSFDEARALLAQLPGTSQPVVELKNLMVVAEAEVDQQQKLLTSALQKAESALIVGHYITPPDDNVLVHCNRGLSIDPQNQKLLTLKKDVVRRSLAQAKDWIQRRKFDEARLFYSSLNYLSQNDSGFPISHQEIQQELERLEFTAYPVIHEHKFGPCTGRLRMNAYVLSFVPSGDSSHGFMEPLRNVRVTEIGERLKVRLDDKTYEFRPNSGKESASSREAFRAVYEHLMDLVAKAN